MLKQKSFIEEVEKIDCERTNLPSFLVSCTKKQVVNRNVADLLFLTDSDEDSQSSRIRSPKNTKVQNKTPTSIAAPK